MTRLDRLEETYRPLSGSGAKAEI